MLANEVEVAPLVDIIDVLEVTDMLANEVKSRCDQLSCAWHEVLASL